MCVKSEWRECKRMVLVPMQRKIHWCNAHRVCIYNTLCEKKRDALDMNQNVKEEREREKKRWKAKKKSFTLLAYEKESKKYFKLQNIHKNMHIHPLCAIVIIIESQSFELLDAMLFHLFFSLCVVLAGKCSLSLSFSFWIFFAF